MTKDRIEMASRDFDKILEEQGLSTTKRGKDEWGDRVYKHPHIQSMFDGWLIGCEALQDHKEGDVETLKKSYGVVDAITMSEKKANMAIGWNDCIDHLATKGLLRTAPE